MQFLVEFHSILRWFVLLVGGAVVIKYGIGFVMKNQFGRWDDLLASGYVRTLEIQALLGAVLFLIRALNEWDWFIALHSTIGLGAVGIAHLNGRWKDRPAPMRFRNGSLTMGISLVVTLVGIFVINQWESRGSFTYQLELSRVLEGHAEPVRSVDFSPDGKNIVSGSFDKTIRLWQVSDGALLDTLVGHEEAVRGVAFSPDGKSLASVSFDRTLRLWQMPEGTVRFSAEVHAASINKVQFTPDGSMLVTASLDNEIILWQTSDGVLVRLLDQPHQEGVLSAAIAPDGKTVASGGIDQTIRIQTMDGELIPFVGSHLGWVYDVAFSPDGKNLASASTDGTVRIWDVDNKDLLFSLEGHEGTVQTIAYAPKGDLLASGAADSKIYLWDPETGILLSILDAHEKGVLTLSFSHDGNWLASGSADGTVILWRVNRIRSVTP